MTKAQAEKLARKRWGKQAIVRQGEDLSSPERRAKGKEQHTAAHDEILAIEKEIAERLAALEWYQELLRRKREALKRKDAAFWPSIYYRFEVGTFDGLAFSIKGQGDTFEQAFEHADERRAAAYLLRPTNIS